MTELKRVLGLPALTFYGIGMIMGAGIYTIIGKAAGIAGDTVWLSLAIAAISACFAALSYAELASMYPKVGGEFIYLRKAFPKFEWISNSCGLIMAFAGVATSATVALAFAGYFIQFISFSPLLIAFAILAIFTVINLLGIKESSWVNIVFTLIEVGGLILFIYVGQQSPKFGQALSANPTFATLSASSLIIFAYFGFENIVNFVEETKNPEKTLPRAIILSIAFSSIIYILVALSIVSLLSINELAVSAAPLSDAVRPVSVRLAGILGSIALFATGNTVLIALLTTSRILYGMSKENVLPKIFSSVLSKKRTPWFASIVILIFSLALVTLNKVEVLAAISSIATLLAFLLVHIAVIVLRNREPDLKRPFRVPWSIKNVPLFPVLGVLTTVTLFFQFESKIYIYGGGFVLTIVILQLMIKFFKELR